MLINRSIRAWFIEYTKIQKLKLQLPHIRYWCKGLEPTAFQESSARMLPLSSLRQTIMAPDRPRGIIGLSGIDLAPKRGKSIVSLRHS